MNSKRSIIILSVVLASLLLVGCGSSTTSKNVNNSAKPKQKVAQAQKTSGYNKQTKQPSSIQGLKEQVIEAKKNRDAVENKLFNLYQQHPRWTIKGEISNRQKNSIIVWGTAESDDAPAHHKGWLEKSGNIKLLNPRKNKINKNRYQGGTHWYIKQVWGENSFGQEVPVKVYGAPPKVIVKARQNKRQAERNLAKKISELIAFVEKKYEGDPSYVEFGDQYSELCRFLAVNVSQSTVNEYNLAEKTVTTYEQALDKKPEDVSLLLKLANVYNTYHQQGRTKAQDCYQKIVQLNPEALMENSSLNSLVEAYDAGLELLAVEHYKEAAKLLKKAQTYKQHPTINMKRSKALTKYGDQLIAQGKREQGVKKYKTALAEIKTLEDQGELNKSINRLEDLKEASGIIRKRRLEIYQNLADIYNNNNSQKEMKYRKLAIQTWDKMFEFRFFTVVYNQGTADNLANTLIQNSINDSAELVKILSKQEKWSQVFAELKRAIKISAYGPGNKINIDLDNDFLHYLLGRTYYKLAEEYDDFEPVFQKYSCQEIEKAIELKPDSHLYHNTLGYIYCAAGTDYEIKDDEQAAYHLEKAIELNPDYKLPKGNLSVYVGGDKYEKYSSARQVGMEDIEEILQN